MYAWRGAFDSVPHRWIIESCQLIGINNKRTSFTKKTMSHWKRNMHLHIEGKLIETEDTET